MHQAFKQFPNETTKVRYIFKQHFLDQKRKEERDNGDNWSDLLLDELARQQSLRQES